MYLNITQKNSAISRKWLILAFSSLAIAGLFSLPPVILRGSFFSEILPVKHIFDTSLVIHVNLSVLVWMLSIGGFFWSTITKPKHLYIANISYFLCLSGMIVMTLSAFNTDSIPLKNNYIPVIQNFTFFMGLSIFACGIIFQSSLATLNIESYKHSPVSLAIHTSAIITLVSIICFMMAYNKLEEQHFNDNFAFYETVFWGGGHILQFTYTSLAIASWMYLSGVDFSKSQAAKYAIMANLAFVILCPIIYLVSPVDETFGFFTQHMRYLGGIASIIIAFIIVSQIGKPKKLEQLCTILSIIMFGYGGILGYAISGSNAIIPAHYHGSIIGITIIFMALVYHFFTKLDIAKYNEKWAFCQPIIYFIGQFLHITGLGIMGGYGALRKDPGSSQNIDTIVGKLMFFSGGSLAIVGGLMFVVILLVALTKNRQKNL